MNLIGRYLWGRTNSIGDPYFGQLTIPSINVGQPGTYEMTFYVVMYCDGTACSTAGDSIKVIINEQTDNIIETIDYDNIGNLRRWEKRTLTFSVNDPEIEVIFFFF